MIVTAIQLACDGEITPGVQCANHYPEDGAVNGAGITHADVRRHARMHGWRRKKIKSGTFGFFIDSDLCPNCIARLRT